MMTSEAPPSFLLEIESSSINQSILVDVGNLWGKASGQIINYNYFLQHISHCLEYYEVTSTTFLFQLHCTLALSLRTLKLNATNRGKVESLVNSVDRKDTAPNCQVLHTTFRLHTQNCQNSNSQIDLTNTFAITTMPQIEPNRPS